MSTSKIDNGNYINGSILHKENSKHFNENISNLCENCKKINVIENGNHITGNKHHIDNQNIAKPFIKKGSQTPLHLENGTTISADLASVTNHENFYTYELLKGIADWLLKRVTIRPTIGIICGSGMGSLADMLTESKTFPYEVIPHFPQSTVPGHAGRLVFGKLCGVPIICMQGRFHYYEGYPLWKCSMPVRVMKLVGVTHLIVTNAAGGLNPDFKCGDIMIMKDHVNFMGFAGNNPLQGVNEERFGPRFLAMNRAYDAKLRSYAKQIAKDIGTEDIVKEGVYAVLGGPNFETIAELRLLRTCGVDAVGMSTVHEVLMAYHAGMTVFAFSLITNKCVMDYEDTYEVNHTEVMDTGKLREPILKEFVAKIVQKVNEIQTDELNKINEN